MFHISSIFSTQVTLSCEPQCDKCNYLTLCFTRPHINMPVLSAENRDNNRRKCECSSSHNCCFTVRLDRRSDNIQKKNAFFSLLFIYRYVILHMCSSAPPLVKQTHRAAFLSDGPRAEERGSNGTWPSFLENTDLQSCTLSSVAAQKLPELGKTPRR